MVRSNLILDQSHEKSFEPDCWWRGVVKEAPMTLCVALARTSRSLGSGQLIIIVEFDMYILGVRRAASVTGRLKSSQ